MHERDLDATLEMAGDDLRRFRGTRIFLTGGTGFIGTWVLSVVAHANRRAAMEIQLDVLTRDPADFLRRCPEFAGSPGLRLIAGDVRGPLPIVAYDGIIHAATPSSATINNEQPHEMLATIVEGQRNVLTLAKRCGNVPLLFTSSGAVYGRQPLDLDHVPETFLGGPDPLDPYAAYHEGKRVAELLSAIDVARGGASKIARLFAFVGPYLPTDRHFAAGNFISDALSGKSIVVSGDGTPLRSYLYPTDMIAWLWAVFARGENGRAYNIGSEESVAIATLARTVAACAGNGMRVDIRKRPRPDARVERYVPSTKRIREELGVSQTVGLTEAIDRTIAWHRRRTASV